MKGIILAGGLGTRFRPLSHTGPKQLVPIANKPVLYYVIEDLVEAGIKEIGIVVGYTEEKVNAIKDAVGDGSRWNCKVAYIQQDAPRGLAHAVGICRDFIGGEAFIVYLGDNILREGIVPYASEFYKSDADAYLLVAEVEEPNKYGIAVLSEAGELIDVEEKPQAPRSNLAIIGVYMFKPCIFEMIDLVQPSWRGELEITDAIRKLLRSGKYTVLARQITGWWDDTGTVEAVLNANNLILSDLKGESLGEIEEDVRIIGQVKIGEGTKILKGSVVKGPSIIGDNCLIGPDSYIGGYTSIGHNVTVKGGEIESSIIYNNVTIRYKGRIVDSIIGDYSEILNGQQNPKGE